MVRLAKCPSPRFGRAGRSLEGPATGTIVQGCLYGGNTREKAGAAGQDAARLY